MEAPVLPLSPRSVVRALYQVLGALLLPLCSTAAQSSCPPNVPYCNPNDVIAPTISFSPLSGGSYTDPTLAMTITWRDYGELNGGSRSIALNSIGVTNAFGYSSSSAGMATSNGSITLRTGTNTLTAYICDKSGNCGTASATYTLTAPPPPRTPPTVTIKPGARTGLDQGFTIQYSDDDEAAAGTQQIVLNGADVTNNGSFQHYQGWDANTNMPVWVSEGAVRLIEGGNTLDASIQDNAGTVGYGSWSEFVDVRAPSAALTPDGGVYNSATVSLGVLWCDNNTLGSVRLVKTWTMDAMPPIVTDLTQSFQPTAVNNPNCGRAMQGSGSFTIENEGTTTITADACDAVGNCSSAIPKTFTLDQAAPTVTVNPSGGGTYGSASLQVSMQWSDNNGVASRTVTLNGSDVIGSFPQSYAGSNAWTSTGTVTLQVGSNALVVQVCDVAGNCTPRTANYILDTRAPTAAISPPSGSTYKSSTLGVTVSWGDDYGLNAATRSVILNGVDVTGSFGYGGSATSATSTGNVTLGAGSNTLTARICDVAGHCSAVASAIYTYDGAAPHVAITPSIGGIYTNPDLPVTVTWRDNEALAATTRRLTLNGNTVTSAFSYTGSGTVATSADTVRLVPGGNTLTAQICDAAGNCSPEESATYTLNSYAVQVTPDNTTVTAEAEATGTQRFVVKNVGNMADAVYDVSAACEIPESCVDISPAVIRVSSGDSAFVDLTYKAGGAGASERIAVLSRARGDGRYTDEGSVIVGVPIPTAQAPVVVVKDVNPGTTADRDLCLTIAAGPDAAYSCGELRITHALPTTRTLGQARTPVLVYRSGSASPYQRVAVNVKVGSVPDKVTATLKINGAAVDSGTWAGADWRAGATRRITLGFRADSQPTGLRGYTLEVTSWYPSGPMSTQVADSVNVMGNGLSPLGAGWWLAGHQHLNTRDMVVLEQATGSTWRYTPVANEAGTWTARGIDRPDVLRKIDTTYVRYLPHGAQVIFNSVGKHIATVNRLGHRTSFTYDGYGRLTTITVPPAAAKLTYQFSYGTSSAYINEIVAPSFVTTSGVTRRRAVRIVRSSSTSPRVDAIEDYRGTADSAVVRFTYHPSTYRIRTRADRRGTLTTYTYDASQTVSQASTDMGSGQLPIVTRFRAAESQGRASTGVGGAPSALQLDSVYTILDGPRDISDTTRFWLDQRFGTPGTVQDALGNRTTLVRGDARWPASVTKVVSPNRYTVSASYDDRGNLKSRTEHNAYGDGRDATTEYQWDQRWDFVTRVQLPTGQVTTSKYDTTYGLRQWQQVGTDSARRVRFGYDDATRLVKSITTPASQAAHLVLYDARGNVKYTRTPKGYWTAHYADRIGQDSLVISPIDTVSARDTTRLRAAGAAVRTWYDRAGRVDSTQSAGPALTYGLTTDGALPIAAETLSVRSHHDPEGNLERLSRLATPDLNAVGVVTTRWTYDRANRKLTETAPDGAAVDRFVYDAAGNLTDWTNRLDHTITMRYDALNRLVARVVPARLIGQTSYESALTIAAVTDTFSYDEVGRLRTADNPDARVARHYYPNGALKADTLSVRTITDADFGQHLYGLQYTYDLSGRRQSLEHPATIAPWQGAKTEYAYDDATGDLASITAFESRDFEFFYDLDGRLDSLAYPSGVYEKRTYDADGNTVRRVHHATRCDPGCSVGGSTYGPVLHSETLLYDAVGRVSNVTSVLPSVVTGLSDNTEEQTHLWYSGLGSLAATRILTNPGPDGGPDIRYNEYRMDALGNRSWTRTHKGDVGLGDSIVSVYEQSTGRLLHSAGAGAVSNDSDTSTYDAAGNRTAVRRQVIADAWFQTQDALSHYGADNKLRVVDSRASMGYFSACGNTTCPPPPQPDQSRLGAYEEYRYDALGRRVLTRTRREIGCHELCQSTITRTIWDGDQILYELRYYGGSHVPLAELERESGFVRTTYNGVPIEDPPADTTGGGGGGGGTYNVSAGTSCRVDEECPTDPPSITAFPDTLHPYGRVLYTHGPGIDSPLGIYRMDGRRPGSYDSPLSIVPLTNWQGAYDIGTIYGHPTPQRCSSGSPCELLIDWSGRHTTPFLDQRRPSQPRSWMGSLVEQQQDGSGLLYRRNRYYDPVQGRFTQEDPIGLAGGMNVYGYANGDPVNYADPFGLCPNRTAGGWGSLQCALEDIGAGGRVALRNAGASLKQFWSDHGETIITVAGTIASARGGGGGGRMGLRPNPKAVGPHSTFRVGPNGKATHYETWQPQTNPRNPAPWESVKRFDAEGDPHFNKATQEYVPTPHVHDPRAPGGVRPANPSEIPR